MKIRQASRRFETCGRLARPALWIVVALLVLSRAAIPFWVQAAPLGQEPGQNLLRNPGFEGLSCSYSSPAGECTDNWTRDTFVGQVFGEIFTPQGWVTYWSEGVTPDDPNRLFGRPECKIVGAVWPYTKPPARIRSGYYAVQQFGFFRPINSGIYQVVTGLSPRAVVQLTAYAEAWSCDDDSKAGGYSCGDPYNMGFRVGIDQNGGTDPWSPNIVWSAVTYSNDAFRLIGPVQATVGDGGVVTVFLSAATKWAAKHNDAYWDDAALVYLTPPAPPTNTPRPPAPTTDPSFTAVPVATARPTSTPRPDGAIVHTVQAGETAYTIALLYAIPYEQVAQLNAGAVGANGEVAVGQELIISPPIQTPTPTASPTPDTASICVLVYNDRDGNTSRTVEAEELLAGAVLSVGTAAGLVQQVTTNGLNEPYCFAGLPIGDYRVVMQPPPGYAPSGLSDMAVTLGAPGRLDVAFGARQTDAAAAGGEELPANGANEPVVEESDESATLVALRSAARVSGIAVLVLAAALGVVIFLPLVRRKAVVTE